MKILNIMIVMLVLIMSVGAVCAADDISDEIISDDGPEILESTQDDVISVGETPQSFSQLNKEVRNATGSYLELNTDYKFNASTDNPNGIAILIDNFVLDGKGHTIDADNQAEVFVVNANNVTINNLTIINAYADNGAALFINPNFSLTTNNVNINNCSSTSGVIYVTTNATYTSNNDKITDVAAKSSGAIGISSGSATFNNVLMTSSKALSWGFINGVEGSNIAVLNSVFANATSNYSTAIKGDKSLKVKNTKFINLHANFTAGAIAFKMGKEAEIENCTFENVSSSKNGGALFVDAYLAKDMPAVITNSTFVNCYSGFGGAILALGSNITIENCNFKDNLALFDGGAIYGSYSNMMISDSTFDGNGGQGPVGGRDSYGGAIYCDAAKLSMYDSKLINNFAQTGSAIYLHDSDYDIKNNEFNNNSDLNGTYNDIYSEFDKEATLENNTYSGDNTTNLNNKLYGTIIDIPGAEIELIENSIDVTTLPSKFDLRDWNWVTPVKNQGAMASCWAFSASAPLESAILRYTGISMSLSENNIQNIGLEYSKYGVNGMKETGIQTVGGSYALAWFGVFSSEYDAYDQLGKVSPIIAPASAIHFQDMVIIPARKNATDNNPIKEAVLKYGAVGVGYATGRGPYINGSSQYCYDDLLLDHGVTIIGWDDNYPKEMFYKTPPGDGAWIIKNSWGEDAGDHGYYYISYYDVNFSTKSTATAYPLTNNVQYDKNYQTDVMGVIDYANNSNTYMNIYEALDNDAIAAVGTYFNESGLDYTVEIYVNDVLKHNQTGVSPFSGFHTIQLDTIIPIKKGDIFAAKIISNSVPKSTLSRLHYLENTSKYLVNGNWVDASSENVTCVLKVYTVELPVYTEDLVKIYKNASQFEANIGVANETVTFEINGGTYNRISNENGTARMTINLNPGNYTIKTTYNNSSVENTITVLPTLIGENLVKYYRNASQFFISLIDGAGNPVSGVNITMNINGVFYNRVTNENGTAKLNINLEPGEYILTALDPLTGLQMSYNITVLPVLFANDMEMKFQDGSTFNALVLNGQGNPLANAAVTFNINGVFYTRYTNSSGIAKLNINLMAGEYIITSEFDGMRISNTITIKD